VSAKRIVARIDGWQRTHALGGFPIAVVRKFGDDRASSLAVLVAYYAFFSLFPLLLAFVSILGFVLEGDPELQQDIVDSALARIPVIGAQLEDQVHPLTGSGLALAVGLAGALWGGLGVTLALTRAFSEVGNVPRLDQPNGLKARARGLAILALIAVALITATVLAGLATAGGIGGAGRRLAAVAGTLAVNLLAFGAIFAALTAGPRRIGDLLPGVTLAALGSVGLQAVGGWYVDAVIDNASDTYGTFALVIGLLSWFLLGAHLLLIAAEVNAVRRWRLWPRALTGTLEPADRLAFERAATATRSDPRVHVAVSIDDEPPEERAREG
jgi:uncharacterized BrkB/YihY/UPF0761 family membrane protein